MKENSFLFSTSGNSGLSKARARFLTQAIQLEEQGPPRPGLRAAGREGDEKDPRDRVRLHDRAR